MIPFRTVPNSKSGNRRNRGKIDTPSTHMDMNAHVPSLEQALQ